MNLKYIKQNETLEDYEIDVMMLIHGQLNDIYNFMMKHNASHSDFHSRYRANIYQTITRMKQRFEEMYLENEGEKNE